MHVVVIGAGVIGVTTAYYLSQQGCQVTVVERGDDVACGASFGNGGQLSYSFTDALGKPEFLAQIPALIAGRDSGSKVRLSPSLIPWGSKFLSQCTRAKARQNTVDVLKLALRSANLMDELRSRLHFNFEHRDAGKLVLLSDESELRAAERNTRLKHENGSDVQLLDRHAAIAIEPALGHFETPFVGAVYSKSDAVGDANLFTRQLRNWLETNADVSFVFNASVTNLRKPNGRVTAVAIDGDDLDADATIACMGAWTQNLLQPVGVRTNIYPVRGYSITLPPGDGAPDVSVSVLNRRIVYSRLNGAMRIAGFADFNDFRTKNDSKRVATLLDVARQTAPLAASFDAKEQHSWGGFRPMTPNGQPLVGESGVQGLYLNTGHGMLGWTLACATAKEVADVVLRTAH